MQQHERRSHALLRREAACGDPRDVARAHHQRRALEGAIEHGIALLEALGLPRVVTSGFVPIDPATAGAAIDEAIAALDEADAPGEDLEDSGDAEPSLGWRCGVTQGFLASGGTADLELDASDWEPWLASPERHPTPPGDPTGRRFVDRSPNARQTHWAAGARHDGETVDEDGDDLDAGERDTSDDEPSLGRSEAVDQRARNCGRAGDAELDPVDDIETVGPGVGLRRADRFALVERARAIGRRRAAQRHATTQSIGSGAVPVSLNAGALAHA